MANSWSDYISILSSALRCKKGNNSNSRENMDVQPAMTFSEENLEESPDQSKPLFRAIRSKNLEEFRLVATTLTARDANECRDEDGYTALHRLVSVCDDWDESVDAVDVILERGADPNIPTHDNLRRTALHLLIETENFSERRKLILKHLLNKDEINVNICDRFENSALKLAVEKGNLEVAEMLILRKAAVNKPDDSGCTPLYFAVKKENPEMAEMLLKNGADSTHLNDMEHCKQTALHVAVETKYPELVAVLLNYGNAEALLKKNKNGDTPQATAERMLKKYSNSEPVKNILKMLSDPESRNFSQNVNGYLGQSNGSLGKTRFTSFMAIPPECNVYNVNVMNGAVAAIGSGSTVNIDQTTTDSLKSTIPDSQNDDEGAEEQMLGQRNLSTENVSNPGNLPEQSHTDNNPTTNININNDGGTVVIGEKTCTVISPIRENGSDGANTFPFENKAPVKDNEKSDVQETPKLVRVKLEK